MVTPSFQLPSLFQLLALALTFAHSTPASSSSKCSKPAQERNVLHVDDFVKQMGRKVPLQAAVQWSINVAVEASNTHPTALLFGPHEYRLASSDASAHKPVLEITNSTAHALRIDGCGASIVVTTPMTGLFEVTAARVGGWRLHRRIVSQPFSGAAPQTQQSCSRSGRWASRCLDEQALLRFCTFSAQLRWC